MSALSTREKILSVVAALAVVAAIAAVVFNIVTAVPSDAAAKVNDTYISETDIANDIASYRSMSSLTDNTDFATSLVSAGENVNSFRQGFIDQRATNLLVDQRAKELGLQPSDDDIQAQIDTAKNSLAFGDDSTWESTLSQYGMTEQTYREQIKVNLEKQALYEKEVSRTEATDDDALSYAESNLVGVTQKHYYRIMLTGDGAANRANEVKQKLDDLAAAGSLNTDSFGELAREYSDEADVEHTGGSFAWSVDIVNDSDLGDMIDGLKVGEYCEPNSVASDDGAQEILYCDAEYSFPSNETSMASLKASDVPESLWEVVKEKATDALWDTNCEVYLSNLLGQAKMTYYPVPDNAAYNVAISAEASGKASESSSTSGSTSGTSGTGSASSASSSASSSGSSSSAASAS